MSCCKLLNDYAILMDKIRCYCDDLRKEIPYEEALGLAIEKAIDECRGEGILKEFLEKHRKEVFELSMFEFSEDDYQEMYREEGRVEGETKERLRAIRKMIEKGFAREQILMLYSEEEYEKANAEMLKPV